MPSIKVLAEGRRRTKPFLYYSRVAQLVEHGAVNFRVAGSSPAAGAQDENCSSLRRSPLILTIIKIIIVFKDSKEKLRLWLTLKIAKVTDIEKYNLYLIPTQLSWESVCLTNRRSQVRTLQSVLKSNRRKVRSNRLNRYVRKVRLVWDIKLL